MIQNVPAPADLWLGLPIPVATALIALGSALIAALLTFLGVLRMQGLITARERKAEIRKALAEFSAAALDFVRIRISQWMLSVNTSKALEVLTAPGSVSEGAGVGKVIEDSREKETKLREEASEAQIRLNSARCRLCLFETPEVQKNISDLCDKMDESRPTNPPKTGSPIEVRAMISEEVNQFLTARAKYHKL